MKREYIGRCDICNANLYNDDDSVRVGYPVFSALTICRNCCVISHGHRYYDITDLVNEVEEGRRSNESVFE